MLAAQEIRWQIMCKWFESRHMLPLSATAASVYLCSICCLISKISFKFYQHMKKKMECWTSKKKISYVSNHLEFITKHHSWSPSNQQQGKSWSLKNIAVSLNKLTIIQPMWKLASLWFFWRMVRIPHKRNSICRSRRSSVEENQSEIIWMWKKQTNP